MLIGWNDWDEALEESYIRGVLEGRIKLPEPPKPMTLEDYGKSITFTLDEIIYDVPFKEDK